VWRPSQPDLRGDEFLQDAAGFVVVGGEQHFLFSSSFRGGAKRRTRNLDIVLLTSRFRVRAMRAPE
jgi:hypothetical protein